MTRPRFSRIIPQLLQPYRDRAAEGHWHEAMRRAQLIGGADRSMTAEAHYAYGYALEQLGELEQAAAAYQAALFNDRRHEKARRALVRTQRALAERARKLRP